MAPEKSWERKTWKPLKTNMDTQNVDGLENIAIAVIYVRFLGCKPLKKKAAYSRENAAS